MVIASIPGRIGAGEDNTGMVSGMPEKGKLPPTVEAAAADRNLGSLVVWRAGSNPIGNFLFFIGVAVALLAASGVLAWLVTFGLDIDGALIIVLALAAVGSVLFAFVGLAKGFTAMYVYQHGLIRTRNGTVHSAGLDEIDELQEWQGAGITAGKKLFYRIVLFDGRRWDVETAGTKDKSTALVDTLTGVVRYLGRPMVVRPRPGETPPAGSEPSKFLVGSMLAAIAVVAVGLHLVGVSGWLSATAGFVVVGGVLRLIGVRTTSPVIRLLGSLFLVTGGLVFLGVTIPLLHPVNAWVTTAVTLAAEGVLVRLIRSVYWRVAHSFGDVARRLHASRHGWKFAGDTTVEVPGPHTAARLLAVPNSATQTAARATMRRAVQGVEVTVFDRARRRRRSDDRPQTVWYLRAPVRSPLLLPAQLGYPETARWWIDGAYLIFVADARGAGGTPAMEIERRTGELVRLVMSLDWQRIEALGQVSPPAPAEVGP
jgi:hypothetical protein